MSPGRTRAEGAPRRSRVPGRKARRRAGADTLAQRLNWRGMAEAENIALYRRFVEEGVGVGRLEVLEELLAPDLSIPTLGPSFEPTEAGLRQFNEATRAGIPDLRAAIEKIFASGDWVAAKVTWSGTQTG